MRALKRIAFEGATLAPAGFVLMGMVVLATVAALSNSAGEWPWRDDQGITRCPAGAEDALLSSNSLQCWLDAPHGRWRRLSHQSAHGALVVHVEATNSRDGVEITRRLVVGHEGTFVEVLVYVQQEFATGPATIRRVRWTPRTGFETMDFALISSE